ncbi:two-component system chemotaxis response regulator CheB [Geodermatophilus normandii]|uniref:protein-glutamate methylesterase n=1 Tax=Geodermatophilus normandii TaxID=1137989 RepID=A0A317QJ47_9ACTN|nr:chemotaxis protein CheB [Geodermatophilus normandii]PWW22726.1 two-component system chemotaxis response regulator CheB [Geodermatophilus normandii]
MTVARRDLVVVGASAGGVESLRQMLGSFPPDLPAAVLVVLHLPTNARSALPAILDRVCALPVRPAVDGDPLQPGTVLVASPDRHLMVSDGHVLLSRGPRENGHRPAVDVLFRSAARAAGRRVIAVVLSGALDDGTAGMIAVRARGGIGVAQDPDEALYPGMPQHAVEIAGADHVVPVEKMGPLLAELLAEDVGQVDEPPPSELMDTETAMAHLDREALDADDRPGRPSGFGCPTCHGALFSITEGGMERYRCRVGHAWSPEALAVEQSQALESALWMALRGLEERATLSLRMGERAEQRGHLISAQAFRQRHDEALHAAGLLRRLLEQGELNGEGLPGDAQGA